MNFQKIKKKCLVFHSVLRWSRRCGLIQPSPPRSIQEPHPIRVNWQQLEGNRVKPRSCKRSDTLFQKFLSYFRHGESTPTASQLTSPASQKSKDLNKVPLLLQDLVLKNRARWDDCMGCFFFPLADANLWMFPKNNQSHAVTDNKLKIIMLISNSGMFEYDVDDDGVSFFNNQQWHHTWSDSIELDFKTISYLVHFYYGVNIIKNCFLL